MLLSWSAACRRILRTPSPIEAAERLEVEQTQVAILLPREPVVALLVGGRHRCPCLRLRLPLTGLNKIRVQNSLHERRIHEKNTLQDHARIIPRPGGRRDCNQSSRAACRSLGRLRASGWRAGDAALSAQRRVPDGVRPRVTREVRSGCVAVSLAECLVLSVVLCVAPV